MKTLSPLQPSPTCVQEGKACSGGATRMEVHGAQEGRANECAVLSRPRAALHAAEATHASYALQLAAGSAAA